MESQSGTSLGHPLAVFTVVMVLLGVLTGIVIGCSDQDLVIPGNIPPTIPGPTATPDDEV